MSILIFIKDRFPMVAIERGKVHVADEAFTVSDNQGTVSETLPVASISAIMLQPGTSISHAAVSLAAKHKCLLLWSADRGTKLYSSGAVTHDSDKIIRQSLLFYKKRTRLRIARRLFQMRFGGVLPAVATIEELRGMEGGRTAILYRKIALACGVPWTGRTNSPVAEWSEQDAINRALNVGSSSLYGLCEAAILISGYSPSIGFLHSGDPRSFVFDIADIFKFNTVVPLAFRVVAHNANVTSANVDRVMRLACKELFWEERLMEKLVPIIEEVLR